MRVLRSRSERGRSGLFREISEQPAAHSAIARHDRKRAAKDFMTPGISSETLSRIDARSVYATARSARSARPLGAQAGEATTTLVTVLPYLRVITGAFSSPLWTSTCCRSTQLEPSE